MARPVNRWSCAYVGFDGGPPGSFGQTNSLIYGDTTETDDYTSCGSSPSYTPGGTKIARTAVYDSFGNAVASDDADATAGDPTHTGCTSGGSQYTACATYDSLYDALPATSTNALNQTTTTGYSDTAGGGWGLWPVSTTDANSQTTTTAYDTFGRAVSATLPGETSGDTTTSVSYSVTCPTTGYYTPCAEEDGTQRLNSSTTVTVQHFYDGYGREIETVTPAPGGQYVVQYTFFDPRFAKVGFQSQPYFVSSAGFSIPDKNVQSSQDGTSDTYDGLGRVLTSTNALSQTTTTSYSVACVNLTGISGTGCYEQTTVVDANAHQKATLADGWGRSAASETFTGNSPSTYTLYQQTVETYDENGHLTSTRYPDGSHSQTATYDDAGRMTASTDPDRGSMSYAYDANGNMTQSVDARGASGTIDAGYDGLNRQVWRNTTNSPTGAYVTYSYDSTAGGNDGVGRLTGESFTGPNSWTGAYSYTYDARGQTTSLVETVNGTNYPVSSSYDDAGHVTSESYPDGEVVATGYTAQGWLGSLSTTPAGQGTTTLVDNVLYSGAGGAMAKPTSYGMANPGTGDVYSVGITYDALGRVTDDTLSGGAYFEETATYDAVGNVTSVVTTLPQGTDKQKFCYDEQNRLVWAGSYAYQNSPCGGFLSPGSLSSAYYEGTYAYDTLNRITSEPPGGSHGNYVYGSAPLDAVGHIGFPGEYRYSAKYDAAGNMICRAPTNYDCSNSGPTAQQLGYDNEGRLISWQNAPSSPTSTASFLYDGEGNRVLQQSTTNGTTTTATYIGSLEEVSTTGGTTTTTTYYYFAGHRIGLSVNGTISYLASDLLGSAEVALNSSGSATASVLYGPYGSVRYTNGAMPTDYVFTGQRGDTTTGLDYYGARYYDPSVGQFTSADSDPRGGLNRYAYVHDDPESLTDPTGHVICEPGTNLCVPPPTKGVHITGYSERYWQEWGRNWRFELVESFYKAITFYYSNGTEHTTQSFLYSDVWCDATCHQHQQNQARAAAVALQSVGVRLPGDPSGHAVDWRAVFADAAVLIVEAAGAIAAFGLFLAYASNPTAQGFAAAVTSALGGDVLTVGLVLLTAGFTALGFFFHTAAALVDAAGWGNSAVTNVLGALATFADRASLILAVATTATTVEGLASVGGWGGLAARVAMLVYGLNTIAQQAQALQQDCGTNAAC